MQRAFLIHPRQIATAPLRSTPAGGLQEGGRKVGGVLISRAARDNHVLAFPRNQILRRIFSGFGVVVTTQRGRRPRRKQNVGCPRPPARPSRRQAHPASTRSNWGPRTFRFLSAEQKRARPVGPSQLALGGLIFGSKPAGSCGEDARLALDQSRQCRSRICSYFSQPGEIL